MITINLIDRMSHVYTTYLYDHYFYRQVILYAHCDYLSTLIIKKLR